jgi:RNA polymerase II subunit A small phosphatase-like protein
VQNDEVAAPEPAEQKQQWLLPPIAPRFQGKKCLVLDLDETLVHSSFKVCFIVNDCIQVTNSSRFYTKQISPFLLKSKANITMST